MKKETLKTQAPPSKNVRTDENPLLGFDLPDIIGKMKRRRSGSHGGLNAVFLLKRPGKRIVLTAFREEAHIRSQERNDSITFLIVEGKLKVRTRNRSITLDQGELLALPENIRYSLKIQEETVLLLTFASGC